MTDPAQAIPDPPPLGELLSALVGTPPEHAPPAAAADSAAAAPDAAPVPTDLAAQAELMDAWVRELRSGGGHTDFP